MIGKTIAKLRKSKGLTQAKFAEEIHVTQAAVSQWETGKTSPDVQQMFILAAFFGVTVETLSSGKLSPSKAETKPAPADDPLTEQIMAKAKKMNAKERQALLKLIDIVMEGKE